MRRSGSEIQHTEREELEEQRDLRKGDRAETCGGLLAAAAAAVGADASGGSEGGRAEGRKTVAVESRRVGVSPEAER
ncbi:hypothetical protein SLE2022_048220 [Rubroshorea leprosula]